MFSEREKQENIEPLEQNYEPGEPGEFGEREEKGTWWKKFTFVFWILFLIILIGGLFGALVYKTSFTFDRMRIASSANESGLLPLNELLPEDDQDRENILLLGYRGEGDPNGGLLTDAIMVLSIQKPTGKVALVSIPRDLFVQVPGTNRYEKINYVYAFGQQERQGQGLFYTKVIVSQVTGLFIDKVVLINFNAFQEVVDALGGITINLEEPFREDAQFSKEIIVDLPAGENELDGRTALYFVRSRYTTSDFDRARRQQQVLLAIKDKALSLGVLTNPLKIFNLLSVLGNNVKTDLGLTDIKELISIYSDLQTGDLKQKVFDTTPQGLLYSSQSENGAYILLPVGGDYSKIQEASLNIFD